MRSEETSAADATLLSSLTSYSFFFVGRRRSFEECEKGESKWTERCASPPSRWFPLCRRRRVASSIGADAAIAVCTSVSKSFCRTAARCVMRQRGSSERCPFFTPPRSPSSSLSSSSSLPSSKSRVALRRRRRPRQMHPSVRLSVAVCREMEFMCDCGSQSQLRTKRRNNISATKGDAPLLRRPRGSDGQAGTGRSLIAAPGDVLFLEPLNAPQ